MDKPVRIQLSRKKGWRMPPNTVKVDRSTRFGNPWTVAGAVEAGYPAQHAAKECVFFFRQWVTKVPGSITEMLADGDHRLGTLLSGLPDLRGKNLACWCPIVDKDGNPVPCHADVLLELANTPSQDNGGR
jgi:hypothetical protein